MKSVTIFSILLSVQFICCQEVPMELKYIEKEKPGVTPQIFSKDFVTLDSRNEFGSVFNSEGNEFYLGVDVNGKAHIVYTQLKDGQWTTPEIIIQDDKYSFNDPFLSPDEQRLYYISNKPLNSLDNNSDYDIWYSEKNGNTWSAPINAGAAINTDANEYYISFTEDGAMYFSSNKESEKNNRRNFDIYKSEYKNGVFQEATKLGPSINTTAYEADVFVSPDESYVIFCSERETGLGRGDLYISFKNKNGEWQEAVSLGAPINTINHELCPYVTSDGKYFFYTSNQDIYWVSTEYFNKFR